MLPDWPRACGGPPVTGVLRASPEDFLVDERLAYEPEGRGNYLWLRVRKRGANTEWVAKRLAELAGVAHGAVGYAGLKDRQAVTTQWFSIPAASHDLAWSEWHHEEFSIITAVRHRAALKRGELAGNDFQITVREVAGDLEHLRQLVARAAEQGVPNYFGEQRFGHDGENLRQAEALFGGELNTRDRHLRGLYLSAARSYLFNRVVAARVAAGSWDRAVDGDHLVLRGGDRHFIGRFEQPEVIAGVAAGRLHPTGPLWGEGPSLAKRTALQVEREALEGCEGFRAGLERAGLRQERRPLRLIADGLTVEADNAVVVFRFGLPAGCYATALLREFVRWPALTSPADIPTG